MSPLYLSNSKLLISNNKIAASSSCCCDVDTSCNNTNISQFRTELGAAAGAWKNSDDESYFGANWISGQMTPDEGTSYTWPLPYCSQYGANCHLVPIQLVGQPADPNAVEKPFGRTFMANDFFKKLGLVWYANNSVGELLFSMVVLLEYTQQQNTWTPPNHQIFSTQADLTINNSLNPPINDPTYGPIQELDYGPYFPGWGPLAGGGGLYVGPTVVRKLVGIITCASMFWYQDFSILNIENVYLGSSYNDSYFPFSRATTPSLDVTANVKFKIRINKYTQY